MIYHRPKNMRRDSKNLHSISVLFRFEPQLRHRHFWVRSLCYERFSPEQPTVSAKCSIKYSVGVRETPSQPNRDSVPLENATQRQPNLEFNYSSGKALTFKASISLFYPPVAFEERSNDSTNRIESQKNRREVVGLSQLYKQASWSTRAVLAVRFQAVKHFRLKVRGAVYYFHGFIREFLASLGKLS